MANHRLNFVLLLTLILWARKSIQYSCNETETCLCEISPPTTYEISCPKQKNYRIDVTVDEKIRAKVKCSQMVKWSDLKINSSAEVEDVKSVSFEQCKLPKYSLHEITQKIRVQPTETLQFASNKNLTDTLRRYHLTGFPKLIMLDLSSNGFTNLPNDLLTDFTELTALVLRDNNVVLPLDFFKNVPKLKLLELGRNTLTNIDPMLFRSLGNLVHLSLWANRLNDLDKDTFLGLNELKILEISHNRMRNIPPEIFQPLGNLTELHMSGNNFSSLPDGMLSKNKNLTTYRFNDNYSKLTTLPISFLKNLPRLNVVELINLKLEVLPEDIFWGSSFVNAIDMSKNLLTTLPRNIFNESYSLKKLNLASNKLSNLPDGIFQALNNLTSLDLQNNKLTSIQQRLFEGLIGLRELNLEFNELRTISQYSFSYMQVLQIARLSHNQLNLIDTDFGSSTSSISGCFQLRELHLSHNNISTIFEDWTFTLQDLAMLDLSYNQLSTISASDFQFLSKNLTLDITHNNISIVDLKGAEIFATSQNVDFASKIVKIKLEDNPIVCSCELYLLLKYLEGDMHRDVQKMFQIDPHNLKCYDPQSTEVIGLEHLSYKTLQCQFEPCPEECTCFYRKYDDTVVANCSHKSLSNAPKEIDSKGHRRVELDLTGNFLTEVPFVEQLGSGNLTKLLLSRNRISSISPENIPSSLVVLELHNNDLVKVNSTVLERLKKSNSLKNLTLHKNPWRCDCEAKDLLTFIQSKFKAIPNLLNVTCENDTQPLSNLTQNDLCPVASGMIVGLSTGVAVLGLVMGILAALYYRYQSEIKVWLYAHQMCLRFVTEEELDKDKLFDAFISYSHKDKDFVENKLVPKLEEGPKPFKLCLHFRDWVAGEWIPTQIARSVEDSKRTIVVLSPNFLESVWGRMEFRAAHSQALSEGRARVIVVLYGDVGSTDKLDPELKAYLSMNTYVQWGDPLFWDKLRYALPHAPRAAKKNAQRIFETHQHHIQIGGDKNELIYPAEVCPTPPAASTPPADTLKTFTSNGSLDKGVLITDCFRNVASENNNPSNKADREWENNVINRECTAM